MECLTLKTRVQKLGSVIAHAVQGWEVNQCSVIFDCNTGRVNMAAVAVFCTITTQFRFYWSPWPYKHRFRHLIYSVWCIIGWTTIKIRKFGNGGTNLHITPTWDTFTAWEHSLSFSTHFFLSEKFSEILVSRGCRGTHFPTKLLRV